MILILLFNICPNWQSLVHIVLSTSLLIKSLLSLAMPGRLHMSIDSSGLMTDDRLVLFARVRVVLCRCRRATKSRADERLRIGNAFHTGNKAPIQQASTPFC